MIPITQNYILHELEFIETRRYTINNSSLHKTHGTVNMLNLVDGKSAVIEVILNLLLCIMQKHLLFLQVLRSIQSSHMVVMK